MDINLPNFNLSVKLKYVKLGYHYLITYSIFYLPLMGIIITTTSIHLSKLELQDVIELREVMRFHFLTTIICSTVTVLLPTLYFMNKPQKVYLLDFACFKPDSALKVPKELFMEQLINSRTFSQEDIDFQRKILERSGLGQDTYLPPAMLRNPPNLCLTEARKEAEMVMFGAIDQVLEKTGVKTKDIGILVVNCSTFTPLPSPSAMIVNRYKLRGNILSNNVAGMGCSAGLISIDLAKRLLQVRPNSYALVVSAENITLNWYSGDDRSMLLCNCLFRTGGTAILLTNRPSDSRRSKYQLINIVRTHKGSDDQSYGCAIQREDKNGKIGISLSKDLISVAGEALKANITALGPLVLPISEQLLFFITLVMRKIFKMKINPYIPDFKLAFEHFCIHTGGRAVLDEMKKNLELSDWHMEPSRMTLYRFGNISSSSLWYELAYVEAKGRIKKGDRIWHIAFGSGFKCNSAVWKALRSVDPNKEKNPWMNEIDNHPTIHVPCP